MREDPVIDSLVQGLEKTKPAPSAGISFLLMLLGSALFGLIFLLVLGVRDNLRELWTHLHFRLEIFLLVGFSMAAYGMMLKSSIPGVIRHPKVLWALLATAFGLLFFAYWQRPATDNFAHMISDFYCFVMIGTNALLPIIAALYLAKKQAPTRPKLTMALALFGSLCAALVVQQLICPMEDAWHLVVWHAGVLPCALIASWGLGRRILGW